MPAAVLVSFRRQGDGSGAMNLLYPKIRLAVLPTMLKPALLGALLAGVYGLFHIEADDDECSVFLDSSGSIRLITVLLLRDSSAPLPGVETKFLQFEVIDARGPDPLEGLAEVGLAETQQRLDVELPAELRLAPDGSLIVSVHVRREEDIHELPRGEEGEAMGFQVLDDTMLDPWPELDRPQQGGDRAGLVQISVVVEAFHEARVGREPRFLDVRSASDTVGRQR